MISAVQNPRQAHKGAQHPSVCVARWSVRSVHSYPFVPCLCEASHILHAGQSAPQPLQSATVWMGMAFAFGAPALAVQPPLCFS